MDQQLAVKAASPHGYAAVAGAGAPGGEDVHGQGAHRRERDPQVSAARHSSWFVAGSPPDPDQEVPGQPRHCYVVQNLHVGRDLPTEHRPRRLVRYRHQAVPSSADLRIKCCGFFEMSGPGLMSTSECVRIWYRWYLY